MSSPSQRRRGVVTGAGSGIGKAVVSRMRREGVEVLAVDINREGLGRFEEKGCETLVADITDPEARAKVADWAEGANYLVNSAGVILIKPIFELTLDDWRRVQAVNAEAGRSLCQKIGPRLTPGGAIVNLSRRVRPSSRRRSKSLPTRRPRLRSFPSLAPSPTPSRLAASRAQRRPAGDCRYADAG